MCLFSQLTTIVFSAVCVPADTCINKDTLINPRIQLPDTSSTPCRPGWVACNNVPVECGKRYVNARTDLNGPTEFGAFPWQVMLRNGGKYIGSGVLIDNFHVLTVAHKVQKIKDTLTIHIGAWNSLSRARNRTAKDVRIHKDYDSTFLHNDVAIIRLNGSVPLGYQVNINSACMPKPDENFEGRSGCVVAGWGDTNFGANNSPYVPQRKVTLPIVKYATCRDALSEKDVLGSETEVDKYLKKDQEFCAGGERSVDACTQDGGAPLVCPGVNGKFTVAGLVAWGKGCGRPGVYGVYVKVRSYLPWIAKNVMELNEAFG